MDLLKRITLNGLNCFQNAINELKSTIEDCDFNKFEREFEEMSQKWENIKSKFKEITDNFVVRVPYNADLNVIKYELNGNTFKVKVVNDDSNNNNNTYLFSYESTIPSDLIGGTITQKYLKNKHEMLFIFKKSTTPSNVANVDELINTINETSSVGNVDSLIDLINETPNEVEDCQTVNEEQNEFEVLIENDENNQVNYENTDEQPMTEEEYRRQQDELIWRLYTEGKSYRKIAKEVGISDKTVARRIKKIIKRTI
jgi:hypothetical protein